MSETTRLAAALAVFLALFSLVFSAGSALGVWPQPPRGGFRGIDLAAGFTFGLGLLAALCVPRRRRPLR